MKVKTTYISDDRCGEYDTAEECLAHEYFWKEANECLSLLKPLPTGNYDFLWRGQYIQQDTEIVDAVRERLIQLTAQALQQSREAIAELATLDMEGVIDLLGGNTGGKNQFRMLRVGWERLWCIDSSGREYSKRYYYESQMKKGSPAPVECIPKP